MELRGLSCGHPNDYAFGTMPHWKVEQGRKRNFLVEMCVDLILRRIDKLRREGKKFSVKVWI
jgi:hypothetical protein